MKHFYLVKSLILIAIITICANNLKSQIIIGGAPAKFGIDADVRANQHLFGTSMPAATGSHDWFSNSGGTGLGVIDTTGATAIKTKLQGGANFLFEMPMAFPKFSIQNGVMMLDARYAHDNTGNDSTTLNGKNAEDPATWSTSPNGSSILDKADIVDTYIHLRRNGSVISGPNPSPLILVMGGSVYSATGNHYMDFELYKSKMQYNRSTGKFSNSGPSYSGGHTRWEFRADGSVSELGDMQVSFSFSGTSVDDINIYIWVSLSDYNNVTPQRFDFLPNSFHAGSVSGYGYAEITAKQPGAPLPVWGVVNSAGTSPAPFWGTNSKTGSGGNGYSTTYGTGEFAEIAIDLTALGTDPAFNPYNNPCNPPFSRMMAKTRSSSSFSSALKDFTGPYEFVDDPMVPATLVQPTWLTCYTPSININPVTVYPSPAVYEWSTLDGNITTRTDSTGIKANKKGTYILKTRSYKGCSSLSDSVFVDADLDRPVIDAGGPYFITNKNPNATLKGNNHNPNNGNGFGPSQGLMWKWLGPNSYNAGSQTTNISDTGTYLLTATELRNGCSSTVFATVTLLNTLPVKLSNFAAVYTNKITIDLKWSASNEDGNETYSLERSTDGIQFTSINKTNATRVANATNYVYRDDITAVSATTVYYKIKIYSHSVLYSESNIIRVSLKETASQPKNSIISVIQKGNADPVISFYSVGSSIMLVMVSDIDGKLLYHSQQTVSAGINSIQLPSANLRSKGIKIVQLSLQTDKLSTRFIYN